jgi:hypothetical protein
VVVGVEVGRGYTIHQGRPDPVPAP